MPYPKRLLNEGEDMVLDLRPHWWYFAKHIFTGIGVFVLFIAILVLFDKSPRTWALGFWAILALLWAIWLATRYVNWNFTHFVVTSDRVIFRTGAFAKHGVEIPMEKINNINFNQGIWERIIGAGDLEIESAGREGQSRFEDTWHPDGVQQEIYRQMEVNAKKRASWNTPQAAAAPTAAPHTIPEQLDQLAALRDRGVITQAEFDAKKAELLGRM